MAEGLVNALYGGAYEAFSAGTEPSEVNPHAIQAMAEIGIDIAAHRSKGVEAFKDREFDYVITVCGHAKETCPVFTGGREYLHYGFEDPSGAEINDAGKMAVFRRVRDEIKGWVDKTLGEKPG